MRTATDESRALRSAVLDAVAGADSVLCYVPGWDPVDLQQGLDWLDRASRGGALVDYRVVHEGRGAKIWFKRWGLDDPEPDWGEEWEDPETE